MSETTLQLAYQLAQRWLYLNRPDVERLAYENGDILAKAVLNTHEAALDPTTVNRRKFVYAVYDYQGKYGT